MTGKIYNKLFGSYQSNRKSLSVLVDPDVYGTEEKLNFLLQNVDDCQVDFLLVGGSLLRNPDITFVLEFLKSHTRIPLVLFPGNGSHHNAKADAILFLSLISGRNPELLIGQQVSVAAAIKSSGLEVLPTGYILIDGGRPTSVSYLSFTNPIPRDKPEIAGSTAIAGELLGMKLIYLEAGSGALYPVPVKMVQHVRKSIDIPLIAGGGIDTVEKAVNLIHAGADVIVIGNKIEQNPEFIKDVSYVIRKYNESLNIH